jgi:hypothetical protein
MYNEQGMGDSFREQYQTATSLDLFLLLKLFSFNPTIKQSEHLTFQMISLLPE